jgi:LAO/AO transport system kinase
LPASTSLSERVLSGDVRALARAISLIEDELPAGAELIRRIYGRTGRAYLIGITGPPGAGKSTLVDKVAQEIRRAGRTVGIICVDPTSPYTGGAILGDRLRMSAHAADPDVFIRSMATRGHLGGLARATSDVALILDAAGKDIVIIETVGVGQDEVDIVRTADISIVTLVPGTGDEVQALKAGIMEIADIFVVNKADREGADRMVQSVAANLALQSYAADEWRPPIVKTSATSGTGVDRLWHEIGKFREHSADTRVSRQRARQEYRLRELLSHRFMQHVEHALAPGEFERIVGGITAREIDPYSAAADIMTRVLANRGSRTPDPGPRIPDSGPQIPAPESQTAEPGSRTPDPGPRIPDPGSRNRS